MQEIEILLVEDNPGDVRLTEEALKEAKVHNNLHVAKDGVEAMEFLLADDRPKPDLILLDLNLPRKDGREVLAEIKEHKDLRRIPVVILTTSEDEEDILRTYDLHANAYITKPIQAPQVISKVKELLKLMPYGRIGEPSGRPEPLPQLDDA